MCGFCGVAAPTSSNRQVTRDLIERMNATIVHRGPDADGIFVQGGIGLGHRRLSIVDVARGAQPMSVRNGEVQMVYNGEVYNHPTLMPELQAAGVQYRTHSDTETILHLYEREGRNMPKRLRGMFAFAIWDARSRELLLARDRLGVKPLYYVHTPDGALYFASEIKALLAAGAVRASLNLARFPRLPRQPRHVRRRHAVRGREAPAAGPHAGLAQRRHQHRAILVAELQPRGHRPAARPGAHRRVSRALPRIGAAAADGRRAVRHVPLRRHRLGVDHGDDEHPGRRADQDVLGRVRRAGGQ